MLAGFHYLEDSDTQPPLGAATFLDASGVIAGMRSSERLVRPYFKGRLDPREMARRAAMWHQQGCRVVCGNEPNLPMEEFGGGAADYAAWFVEVARQATTARLYWAGISPSVPGWEGYYTDPSCRAAIAQNAAGLCVHTYGEIEQLKDVVWWIREQYPDKPIWIGEWNFGAGRSRDVADWARRTIAPFLDWCATLPQVEAATYFAYKWPTPDMSLPTPVDATGTPIEDAIRQWSPPNVMTPPSSIEGVDVSNWQGAVDWGAVAAAGYRFALMKASEDPDFVDPWLGRNWVGAKAAGLVRGVYHFAQPERVTAEASMAHFATTINGVGGLDDGDLVALDIESGTGDLLPWVTSWLELAEQTFGRVPLLYSGHWFAALHNLETPVLGKYPLWWASYQSEIPPTPTGWDKITVWQYSSNGRVPGINGDADLNRFQGTLDELQALGRRTSTTTPVVDVATALRDRTWALAQEWDNAGYPWTASGVRSLVALGKGER